MMRGAQTTMKSTSAVAARNSSLSGQEQNEKFTPDHDSSFMKPIDLLFNLLGYPASALIFAGLYGLGNKWRGAFVFSFLGEVLWMCKSAYFGYWDLFIMCSAFTVLAVRGYIKWK